jgi:uncharacterized membrane-anchored protein YitT (DUF2179 family)
MMAPPARWWIGVVLLAANVAFLEKPSHVSSGGVSALALPVSAWSGLRVGTITIALKLLCLLVVALWGGRRVAFWTGAGAILSGALTWLFELVPFSPSISPWIAAPLLLVSADVAMAMLWSAGYSTGGYAAVSQVLKARRRVPIALSMFLLNAFGVVAMFAAFGASAGALTIAISLVHGPSAALWLRLLERHFPLSLTTQDKTA